MHHGTLLASQREACSGHLVARRWGGVAVFALVAAAAACSGRTAQLMPGPERGSAEPGEAAGSRAAALPAGVLAREMGAQGVIEVIERDGLRQLVIGGAVHAAVPIGGAPVPLDAMVGV